MIVGMPGCGKSLTAKATARLFNIPLVRLDVGRLLGKYVGESEDNMRRALSVSEAISPCVLWIDEIEKAFSGVGSSGGSDVTTRLFGQFLTWMQEKDNSVFIVATANDISGLPPEFLRKGRFDEIFFVDLPNAEERRKIIEIHLKKRRKWSKVIDTIALIQETEGFNGADIEAVVKDTIERAFVEKREIINTSDLLNIIKDTKSISVTLKEKIKKIKETVERMDIKPASREFEVKNFDDEKSKPVSKSNATSPKKLHFWQKSAKKFNDTEKILTDKTVYVDGIRIFHNAETNVIYVEIPSGTYINTWKVILQEGRYYRIDDYGNCQGALWVKDAFMQRNGDKIYEAHIRYISYNGLAIISTSSPTKKALHFSVRIDKK